MSVYFLFNLNLENIKIKLPLFSIITDIAL